MQSPPRDEPGKGALTAQREWTPKPLAYLDLHHVRAIYGQLAEDYVQSADPIDFGERDQGRILESAVSRPKTSAYGELKYPTVETAAAALLHAMIQNHPFLDGNKRTAIVSFLVFLDRNSYILQVEKRNCSIQRLGLPTTS